ncbi:hypothetical protein AB0H88_50210 [Nonomuraea sp. NPDC050680]|uniref:hypothetical protein n=1 Tax=Nonomuraea sp. NPDC050680 TaxID=3154630 RepID=UPI00340C8A3E
MISVRFLKPLTVTLASAALVALPFAGGAFADSGQPQPAPTVTPGVKTTPTVTPGVKTTPTTKPTAPVKTGRPTATDENARPKRPVSTAHERETTASTLYLKEHRSPASLDVSVNPTRVKQGASYGVTIVVRGASAGTAATITSPEGKSYRVSLDQRTVTKTLTVPAKAKLGAKTVTVKVGNRTATAQFTVVRGGDHRDDHRHEGK